MAENNCDTGSRRSKRSASSKTNAKKTVLDKIRKHRETGEKLDYDFSDEKDVYELVDEDKYAKIVQERQEEDFIVDDDGTGYVDDGREIFDDDPNEVPAPDRIKSSKKENKNAAKASKNAKITSMFNVVQTRKKKEKNVTNEGDEVLEDILNSLGTSDSKAKQKVSNKTPKRLSAKHPPRRLQEEQKKKMTLKRRSHLTHALIKPKKEHTSDYEMNMNENIDDESQDIESFSQDSSLGSQEAKAKHEDVSGIEEFPSQEIDDVIEESMLEEVNDDVANVKPEKKLKVEDTKSSTDWEKMFTADCEEEVIPNIDHTLSSLPLVDVNGEKVLRFFWLDAYEDRFHQPGTVYLFGKVFVESSKSYASCCVAVKNIERQLFILPRKTRHDKHEKDLEIPVEFKDVYEEFDQKVATKYKLMEYKCKKTEKNYAFDKLDVPRNHEYLQLIYPANQEQLPSDLKGETFSHVFGTNTSSLEQLFLNRRLHGPSWIDLKYAQPSKHPISWCKVEAFVDKPIYLTVVEEILPPPPLTVLSLSMVTTVLNKSHEIIGVSGLVHNDIHLDKGAPSDCFKQSFCFVTKASDQLLPYDFQPTLKKTQTNIQISPSERSMLGLLLAKVQNIDPDVLVGHDIHGFDLDILLSRFNHNKVPHWSKIGRLRRSAPPKTGGKQGGRQGGNSFSEKSPACGRLVCDVKISAKELIRSRSYDLTELASVILNKKRNETLPEDIPMHLRKTDTLMKLLGEMRMDSIFNLKIMYELNILPLAFQITSICGNVMSRTLLGGRSERNEFLLLHAFSKKNYILPDKAYNQKQMQSKEADDGEDGASSKKKTKGRKKPAYAGGLVLEPKKGFYDKYILLLDFNSLYPSIIQEFNICFTTITTETKPSNEDIEEELPDVPDSGLDAGILPTEIRRLVERRKEVKKLLKSVNIGSDLYLQYDIRQKALKLTANSMYGCLGFSHSRFYAKPLAALVTGKGREILMKTKDLASGLGLDVIYGDTDSIMINTNSEDLQEVRKIGSKVKTEVNKLYRQIEIDIDGIFKSMLLLKKKKYAAVLVDTKPDGTTIERKEMKGLDIVRRDWSDLAKDAGNFVLTEILSCKSRDIIIENIHDYLRNLKEQIEKDEVDITKYSISKGLTKHPSDYPDKKSLPHVTVAQRLMTQGRRVAIGDTISYLICDDSSSLPASQRAYHIDEMKNNSNLKIDKHYYLSSQIHPVVSRLCDPIEGTDSAFIASCLGLDPSAYKSNIHQHDNEDSSLSVLMGDEERFKDVEKFYVTCRHEACKEPLNEFKGAYDERVEVYKCRSCKTDFHINRLRNALRLFVREKINKFYSCWMTCDDSTCGYVSRHVSVKNFKNAHVCTHCNKGNIRIDYNDNSLYNQLLYLSRVFNVDNSKETTKFIRKKNEKEIWATLQKDVEKVLLNDAYSLVNMGNLFC